MQKRFQVSPASGDCKGVKPNTLLLERFLPVTDLVRLAPIPLLQGSHLPFIDLQRQPLIAQILVPLVKLLSRKSSHCMYPGVLICQAKRPGSMTNLVLKKSAGLLWSTENPLLL
jgi:hypothetical protein